MVGGPDVSFVLTANGIDRMVASWHVALKVSRSLEVNIRGCHVQRATPTNTQYNTVDIAGQYDSWADVPLNPLNLVAVTNGYWAELCAPQLRERQPQ